MNLTIHGAARQVTGSMHLLEVNQYKILIDCGLDYEKDRNVQANEDFPFNPAAIDVVILTHAHIDHSGNLPTLIRMGFDGQILCTPPTAELAELLLMDSVSIFLNKQHEKRMLLQPAIERNQIRGMVIYIDSFQNVITNITKDFFNQVQQGRRFILYFKRNETITHLSWHYNEVPEGEKLCLFGISDHLEIAINKGNASGLLGLNLGDSVIIDFQ